MGKEPESQSALIELLAAGCAIVAVGGMVGIPLGMCGVIDGWQAYYFGSQGWEFLELGRIWQDLLLAGFGLWVLILFRGVQNFLTWKNMWSTPAWLFYGCSVMVFFLFFTINMTPKTNFIVSDFWRWLVVHMWVEVTFEIFTTVIVVGHNFYWIAKPTGVIALGSVFSTTQVFPLILLTLDAWKHTQIEELAEEGRETGKQQFVMGEVWLFLLGVNFWNVLGAGLMGSMINLPVINYYEHATFFTGGHAHGAMFGVKGNIALASILYCVQHVVEPEDWCPNLVRTAFWSMNGGIALMMVLSMLPTGLYQFYQNIHYGLWYARSGQIVEDPLIQNLAKMRSVGGNLFVWFGLCPYAWFIFTRWFMMKEETTLKNGEEKPSSWLTEKKVE